MKYIIFVIFTFLYATQAQAQCEIRYAYDAFGNRVQQKWFGDGCRIAPVATEDIANDIFPTAILFPNPTNGIFNIKMPTNDPQHTTVTITTAVGAIIEQSNLQKQQFDLSNQAAGIYFVHIRYQNQMATYKIVVE